MTGRPLAAIEMDQLEDAVLCVWHAGHQAGNGICDVLFGDTAPAASCPSRSPVTLDKSPVYYAQYSTGRPKRIISVISIPRQSRYIRLVMVCLTPRSVTVISMSPKTPLKQRIPCMQA